MVAVWAPAQIEVALSASRRQDAGVHARNGSTRYKGHLMEMNLVRRSDHVANQTRAPSGGVDPAINLYKWFGMSPRCGIGGAYHERTIHVDEVFGVWSALRNVVVETREDVSAMWPYCGW
ncbi:MAG: hypothetical protein C7B45_09500 [Sulfobacillus acidophilus]|uniref:Uncharacterized protein n=1 Tax=Sulfobacillus acidophilus TaxID=53633 RepID=A0A2T2WHV3_9FIRM|nr:MAG: hypothetical protein C7B45_09500 [Sulfobacillus acidophilus]